MAATHRPHRYPSRSRLAFALLAALLVGTGGCLIAEEKPPEVNVRAGGATKFMHRGQVNVDRPVFQASGDGRVPVKTGGDIVFSGLATFKTTSSSGDAWFPDASSGEVNRLDIQAGYSHVFPLEDLAEGVGPIDITTGLTQFVLSDGDDFPFGERDTTSEWFGEVGLGVLGFRPFASFHIDLDEAEGYYINLGVGRTFSLDSILEDLSLDVGVSAAASDGDMSEFNYGIDESGWADARADAELRYVYDRRTTFDLGLHGSTILDDDIRDQFDQNGIDEDNFWVTLGVTWRFGELPEEDESDG